MKKGSEVFRGVLADARRQLVYDFEASKWFAHAGIKGDERAEALAAFLKSRLPPAFGISTGEVIDSSDQRTGQLDLIIHDQTVTRPVHSGRRNELYPCEAVYAVIEVKSIFNRAEAKTCLIAAEKLRQLRPFGENFVDSRVEGQPAHKGTHRAMYVVFAFATDIGPTNWLRAEYDRLLSVATEQKTPLSLIDRLLVLDRGMINPDRAQGKMIDSDLEVLFAEFFLHLVNFLERERNRRPNLSWQQYALPQSKGWESLSNNVPRKPNAAKAPKRP